MTTHHPGPASTSPLNPPTDAAWDPSLKHALQSLPPPADPGEVAALEARVLAQWETAHGTHSGLAGQGAAMVARLPRGWLRQRWVLVSGLASGVALSAVLAFGLGLRIPGLGSDPALDELMPLDVLSQMAIGEM